MKEKCGHFYVCLIDLNLYHTFVTFTIRSNQMGEEYWCTTYPLHWNPFYYWRKHDLSMCIWTQKSENVEGESRCWWRRCKLYSQAQPPFSVSTPKTALVDLSIFSLERRFWFNIDFWRGLFKSLKVLMLKTYTPTLWISYPRFWYESSSSSFI